MVLPEVEIRKELDKDQKIHQEVLSKWITFVCITKIKGSQLKMGDEQEAPLNTRGSTQKKKKFVRFVSLDQLRMSQYPI